ncbi:hypothetical protein, partial [Leptolyngbya sp. FACHB-16]|uniref:hypothetical protein n=1 Tax=unclassified Leptolyngbya TaxID=2650499 RepID=UPI001A7EE085
QVALLTIAMPIFNNSVAGAMRTIHKAFSTLHHSHYATPNFASCSPAGVSVLDSSATKPIYLNEFSHPDGRDAAVEHCALLVLHPIGSVPYLSIK